MKFIKKKNFILMKLQKLAPIILMIFLLGSCEKMLDPRPDNHYGDEFAWGIPGKAQGVLMNAYDNIMTQWDHWSGNNFLDVATDNAITNDFNSGLYSLGFGGLSNQSNPIGNWSNAYEQFLNIHLFLENGLSDDIEYSVTDSLLNERIRMRLKGEAYFLRAWWGMELLRIYGGIAEDGQALGYVILTETVSGDNLENLELLSRNTYEECVQQITNDLDSAIVYLPLTYTGNDAVTGEEQLGRGSGKAAWALKSRVHTYAASPAFQPQGAYAISEDSIIEKWRRAAITSYQAIVEGQLGSFTPLTEANFTPAITPGEFLFKKHFNNNHMENRNFPPYFFGQGRAQPSQNLVDAFPDINGYPIDHPNSVYDPQNPYANRDPRLDLTVYYNDRVFDNRPLEIYYDQESSVFGRDAAGYDQRNTRTGYYLRKWLASEPDMLNPVQSTNQRHLHALLRRSEVYFNLIEALNEAAGPFTQVEGAGSVSSFQMLSNIRQDILGIDPDIYALDVAILGKEEFRKFIQNERRIEFAFENMRYFDMRRWLIPLDEPIRGVEVLKTNDGYVYKGTDPQGEPVIVEDRKLSDPKFYYAPLPLNELLKNPNLRDNRGWSGQ